MTEWENSTVLRAAVDSSMEVSQSSSEVLFSKTLAPMESCDLIFKIPYIALDGESEKEMLKGLDYNQGYEMARDFWRKEHAQGATLITPEPRLDALYQSHLAHVQVSDVAMPDGSGLINTSVGTSVYGNFTNESCMIIHELDQRGLHEDARRRIELWIKYQGTIGTLGNFTDHDGVFYGAGGFEMGQTYNQHHGWVLWCIAEHYFLTGDAQWLRKNADALRDGIQWVYRQRKETMKPLPHSRGWEYGFLPAGALEDVGDYCYWLSTNALTWRGVKHASKALVEIGYPGASELQNEADAYGKDLVNGFETMRMHTPLVRLQDGRWIPNYPSRIYHRGRDWGWIREVLEGSIYLLISGLYPSDSEAAEWILEDYQDNRFPKPPYGYPIPNLKDNWFDSGGISIQPNLLAGPMPYLLRDEPERYIWSFFNSWIACYNEEINAMVEHPFPFLGYSNTAHYKTSDEANAVNWLRYMFVCSIDDTLWVGRAIPREWFSSPEKFGLQKAATPFGKVSIEYQPGADGRRISAVLSLENRRPPEKVVVRFRHPGKASMLSVSVNGEPWQQFSPQGDVTLTASKGTFNIEAEFEK